MKRTTRIIASIASLATIAAMTTASTPGENARKEILLIILDGEPLETPIRSYNVTRNMDLFNALARSARTAMAVDTSGLDVRPCIRMASVMATQEHIRMDRSRLGPEHALFRHWIYPAVPGEPAVTGSGRVLAADAAQILTALGVPLSLDEASRTGACGKREQDAG